MAALGGDPYDLTVGGIDFVVLRGPNADWHIERMVNSRYAILVCALSGRAVYEYDGAVHDVEAGDVMLFSPGKLHSGTPVKEDPWSFVSAAFELTAQSDEALRRLEALPVLTRVSKAFCADRFRELYDCWNRRADGFMLHCRSLIGDLLYMLIREAQEANALRPHDRTMERVCGYIASHADERLTIASLAGVAELSPSHFRMLFRQYAGMTTVEYQNRLRIGRACALLRSGAYSVTETALALGFSDIYYFSRLFKKLTGVNPSEYAKTS